ncbi:hypothetical protein [Tahibacter amnicola]|uniref:Repeat protein (TIGR01451 family) n=1 Tax=Tahibacter amnicola TaxID=2976241 RepID=A0ABY6BBY1_9GAMM|nr:hypothetical protein [Tahibacter amnicola]UXI67209.1 hypothetical protein N4264_21090 [Tahibacter amnicola]
MTPAKAGTTIPLILGDEDHALVNNWTFGGGVSKFTTTAPYICANVGTVGGNANDKLDVTWPGVIPGGGNFVFGPIAGGVQQPLAGVASMVLGTTFAIQTDPSLVCYSLKADGTRKPTANLFVSPFEDTPDAVIASTVVELPTVDNNYLYKYYLDVSIPVMSATTAIPYVVRDGYDSSVFDISRYCEVAMGATTCGASPVITGNVSKNITLQPNTSVNTRFIVLRTLRASLGDLPTTTAPIAVAGLFTYNGMEDRLDNNVAASFTTLSDRAPTLDTTSLATLTGISEGATLQNLAFTITDDTPETAGNLLRANNDQIQIIVGGATMIVPVNCGSTTPITVAPVTRTCTFSVGLPLNAATDARVNVGASFNITVTDSRGGLGHTVARSIPLAISSVDNDAPQFDFGTDVPPDATDSVPTLTCSLADPKTAACGGVISTFIPYAYPGPADSIDELGTQGVELVPIVPTVNGGNIACVAEVGTITFAFGQSPKLTQSGNAFSLRYTFNNPPGLGSVLCSVVMRDTPTLSYPGAQTNASNSRSFRIRIRE